MSSSAWLPRDAGMRGSNTLAILIGADSGTGTGMAVRRSLG
jgi:hypothetical protein